MYISSSREVILLSNKPNSFIANVLDKNIRTIQRKRKDNSLDIYIADCLNKKSCDIATSKRKSTILNVTSDNNARQLDYNIMKSKRHLSDREYDKLCDKIVNLEAEIVKLKNLVITSTKAVLEAVKSDIFNDKSEIIGDKSHDIASIKGSLRVLEDSNTTIESIVIEDSKKENKKRKRTTATFKDDSDRLVYEFFRDNYPKSAKRSKEETCQKYWHKLTDQQKLDALDKIELIKENFKNTHPRYIDKLSNMILERRWEQIDEESVGLANKKTTSFNSEGYKGTYAGHDTRAEREIFEERIIADVDLFQKLWQKQHKSKLI